MIPGGQAAPNYVGFWKRVLASLIDTLILVVVSVPVLFVFYGPDYFSRPQGEGFAGIADVMVRIIMPALFAILFWKFSGATPGKMLVGARIVDAQTLGPPSAGRLIVRYLAYFVSMFPLLLGFFWIAVDRRKQGFHDKLARTVVVEDEDA